MSKIKVNLGYSPVNGKQISFVAPCRSVEAESLIINDVEYILCDAKNRNLCGMPGIWTSGAVVSVIVNTDTLRAYIQNQAVSDKPKAGFIYPLASDTVPEGFLLCDGAEYGREEYPELFAAIGIIYGEGDGETTFNVPNLQTRVPVGAGNDYDLGKTGGEAEHTLSEDEMPSHKHKSVDWLYNYNDWDDPTPAGVIKHNIAEGHTQGVVSNGCWTGQDTTFTGEGQPHNNMPPYTVVNYIIATGEDTAVSVYDIVLGAQAIPLGIEYGGTGATDIATARKLLGITPENIGALPLSGGTMTGSVNMNGNSLVGCMNISASFINGARIRAYDFGKDNIPFVLDRGGHSAYLVVGRTNSGVCVYALGIGQDDLGVEAVKICGGEYANFGFDTYGDKRSITILGSSYAVCYVISIDNWNV